MDADNYKVLTSFDAGGTHSVAADSENIHVFVPINALPPMASEGAQTGITVWKATDKDSVLAKGTVVSGGEGQPQ